MTHDEAIRWLSRIKADLQSMNRHSSPDELKALDYAIAVLERDGNIDKTMADREILQKSIELSKERYVHNYQYIFQDGFTKGARWQKSRERPASPVKAITDVRILINGRPPEEATHSQLVEALKAEAQIASGQTEKVDRLDSHLVKTDHSGDSTDMVTPFDGRVAKLNEQYGYPFEPMPYRMMISYVASRNNVAEMLTLIAEMQAHIRKLEAKP